jgi:DNA-binding NarL/FixJ family response regulator
MKRLLILSDHSFVIHGVRMALHRLGGVGFVGAAAKGVSALPTLARLAPDVVLIDDWGDPEVTLERVREVAASAPLAKSLLLACTMDEAALRPMFEAGAHGAIARSLDPIALGTLVREVVEGRIVHRLPKASSAPTAPADCPLTGREIEILRLVAEGQTNARIAEQLWVTEQTVKFHLSNTYRKLGVANRTEAAHYAHAHHLVNRGDVVYTSGLAS